MSGYAKRMMEEAKRWIAVNPDPGDPLTHVPKDLDGLDATIQKLATESGVDISALRKPRKKEMSPKVREALDLFEKLKAEEAEDLRQQAGAINSLAQPVTWMGGAHGDHPVVGPWLVRWARDGYNVFDLSQDFVAAMLLTDPSALDLSDLRLPFAGLLMTIPDRFAVGAAGGQFTKLHIFELPQVATDDCDGEVVLAKEPIARLVSIMATDGAYWLTTTARFDDLAAHGIDTLGELTEIGLHNDRDRAAMDTVRRIAFSSLAYFVNVERAPIRRPSNATRGRSADARPVYWDVGRTVRIDPRLVQAARAGSREVALRLKHRHIVRGHYRQQPIGEGRKARKTIWIAPFWKGPAEGAQIVHTYKPATPEPS